MARITVPLRPLVLAGLVGLLVAGGAQVAQAHRTPLSVEILSEQGTVSPDGRSISFDIETVCDRQWTIVEARVTATQPQGSGAGPFTPNCGRIPYVVPVTVPVVSGSFQTGPAAVTARLVVQQGPTKSAQDSASLRIRPSVSVLLADQAVLQGDGSILIDVTVTCPVSGVGLGGQVRIYDGVTAGGGTFGPTPCDTLPHSVSVRVSPDGSGSFRIGSAEALASAAVEEGGDQFPGGDFRTIQIVSA
jgi:hypothetical protein